VHGQCADYRSYTLAIVVVAAFDTGSYLIHAHDQWQQFPGRSAGEFRHRDPYTDKHYSVGDYGEYSFVLRHSLGNHPGNRDQSGNGWHLDPSVVYRGVTRLGHGLQIHDRWRAGSSRNLKPFSELVA